MAWDFDYIHSTIEFAAKHMMVTTMRGCFNKFTVMADPRGAAGRDFRGRGQDAL